MKNKKVIIKRPISWFKTYPEPLRTMAIQNSTGMKVYVIEIFAIMNGIKWEWNGKTEDDIFWRSFFEAMLWALREDYSYPMKKRTYKQYLKKWK